MNTKQKNVIVLGDIHARWGPVNALINKRKPSVILQVGDFGWFPHWGGKTERYSVMTSQGWEYKYAKFDQYGLKMKDTTMYWCAGNHENHADLIERSKTLDLEIIPGVWYRPFGSTLTLEDGRVVLFCGGARSTDQQHRIEGISWWKEEEITVKDLDKLPDRAIDIVISHTAPEEFMQQMCSRGIISIDPSYPNDKDGSRQALSYVLNKYSPKLWYFGHWHKYATDAFRDTRWVCLDMVASARHYWEWLK